MILYVGSYRLYIFTRVIHIDISEADWYLRDDRCAGKWHSRGRNGGNGFRNRSGRDDRKGLGRGYNCWWSLE